ncbi:MAG: hypothetical protein ACM3NQ_07770 [Bacteroidales bacterium]
MEDEFRLRVRAAASAAWWTFLVAAAYFLLQWIIYLVVVHVRPGWALSFWGPGATWEKVTLLWFDALVVLKLSLWPLALVALWLTLWARQLRTRGGE